MTPGEVWGRMFANCRLHKLCSQNIPFAFVIVPCDIIFLRHLCVDLVVCDLSFCPYSFRLYELYPTNTRTKQWATHFLLSFSMTCLWLFYLQLAVSNCCSLDRAAKHFKWAVLEPSQHCFHGGWTGKQMFQTQHLSPGSEIVIDFRQKHFLFPSSKICFRNICFPCG